MLRLIFFIAWLLAPMAALCAVQPIAAFTPGARLLFLDAAGNLTNLTSSTSGGASAGYQFDALNRLTNVIDQRLTGTKNTAYTFDGVGNLAALAYPSALEKGIRSEQALKLALAEMYVQGVSTRKVSAIVEELCGTTVSSSQVSACAKLLDAELQKWRERALGNFPYLLLDARYEKVRQNGQLLDCAVLLPWGSEPMANAFCLASASP